MKVIIAGGTGFIGGAALKRLIALPAITSVVALSRREIPIKEPKLQTIIIKDFLNYTPETLSAISDADACIWALGSPTSGKEVHMDYLYAAAKALMEALPADKKFTMVYVSGGAVEADQSKKVWIMGGIRKMRGQIENTVVSYQAEKASSWQTYVARPALVTTGEPFYKALLFGYFIPVEELGAALVDAATNGNEKQKLENDDLRAVGKAALAKAQ